MNFLFIIQIKFDKDNDYCIRYFTTVSLYMSIVMSIICIVGTCLTWFYKVVLPIDKAPFYETSGLKDHFVD